MKSRAKQILIIGGMLLITTGLAIAAPVFTPNSQPTGWLSRPVVTLFDLSSGTQNFYQIDFRKDSWSGNVLAKDINNIAIIQTTGPWDNLDPTVATAASILDSLSFNTDRKIATLGGAFRWANMTAAQKTALGTEKHLNFVRGDRSNEEPDGISLYQRESVLGDILHSNIYFWNHGASQSLYVGSNDGMLHSFDANTGVENWAYVPSMLIPNLRLLANKTYVHTYFVDGPISIAKIDVSGTPKTILVGGLGAGGAGLYALDITSPTATAETDVASKVLWEITPTGSFADLGHTYGTPQFARLNNGTAVVIVGNGYVNTGNGHAVLYVINAVTGGLVSAIDTGSGDSGSPNGLSTPTLFDVEGDGKLEYAYAGDIDGNLWKFDLDNNTSSLLLATSPAMAITTAPAVHNHPLGGQMVAFATGRMLSTGDKVDTSVNNVYGIWDGAPGGSSLVTQTLSDSTVTNGLGTSRVRTVSNNAVNWATHKGWEVALPPGERVVGEMPLYNNGRFYFLATNPTIELGENWIHELVFLTGGPPEIPIFDLDKDGNFKGDADDLAVNGQIPVAKYLGPGVLSQPLLVQGEGLATTLYAYHPDLPISDGVPNNNDPGVSGGHFDFDIYFYSNDSTTTIATPIIDEFEIVNNYCAKTDDVAKKLDTVFSGCVDNATAGYTYLTDYKPGAKCPGGDKKAVYQTLTCNKVQNVIVAAGDFLKKLHVHEYDDKYDVTGVNMLNASNAAFNLDNAIADPTTQFKVLVMNQYLNPAAKLSVGGADYVSVQTYGNLASQTKAATLLAGLPTYTRNTVGTLVFNLPLDAFKAKDWWEDGGAIRAGLIPTKTGCVNSVDENGVQATSGPNGERFNGALTIQLIKPDTPAGHLELNGPDVSYGWRVKIAHFKAQVLVEYTTFWHHPNGACYGDDDWVADPPEDFDSKASNASPPPGTADPRDGTFGTVIATVTTNVSVDGKTTTTTTTYSDGTIYIKIVTVNDDGTKTIYQKFRDGTEEIVTIYDGDGGEAGFIDPNSGSPIEEVPTIFTGRQSWRDIID